MKSSSDRAKALALAKRVKQLIDPNNTWSHKGPLSSLIYGVRQLYGIKMMPRVIKARNASRKVERELVKALNFMISDEPEDFRFFLALSMGKNPSFKTMIKSAARAASA